MYTTMSENKTISLRIPDEILKSLDDIALEQYPNRTGTGFNRTQVILDAIEMYLENRNNKTLQDNVNIDEKIDNAIAKLKAEFSSVLDSKVELENLIKKLEA